MKKNHFFLLLLGVLASNVAAGQNNNELYIPLESDNQFPPENHSDIEDGTIEGSGNGIVEEPGSATTEFEVIPKIEDIKPSVLLEEETPSTSDSDVACPKPCVCNIEGDSNNFVVDCSGYGLTEFPSFIDPRTTTLNLQNNKLTEIPKEISVLKNLKVLNANNNEIMELAPGSISELPELVILKLANNRLIEYPRDLKNSLILTKLEELDLGGNDMRTKLASDVFLQFKSLKKLTLATSSPELVDEFCASLKDALETVCTGSCKTQTYDCPNTPQNIDEDLIDATLPGMIAFNTEIEDGDPAVDVPNDDENVTTGKQQEVTEPSSLSDSSSTAKTVSTPGEKSQPVNEFSLRTAVNKEPASEVKSNSIVNKPEEETDSSSSDRPDVKIGATTSSTNTSGIDKSVIGIIVAAMVVIVAVITIKKNWSSIKKRCSTSRPPNDRTAATANGTSPEEVPLQDKLPV
ncbi:unnamed protein product [Parnassius apollo]|uniref:(apollo) hypothetical protein n=1 Tax=Parnassius apollo TaxID=110799 RepID=A0A8S3XXN5_PARAO|nr:unnamed protein product [Parnassius apollo]